MIPKDSKLYSSHGSTDWRQHDRSENFWDIVLNCFHSNLFLKIIVYPEGETNITMENQHFKCAIFNSYCWVTHPRYASTSVTSPDLSDRSTTCGISPQVPPSPFASPSPPGAGDFPFDKSMCIGNVPQTRGWSLRKWGFHLQEVTKVKSIYIYIIIYMEQHEKQKHTWG
jgi:hypothetical protein